MPPAARVRTAHADAWAAQGALAHVHADTDVAARVYARLGFVEAGALEVFEDV
jgi:predicted GNAT family acetyltransferase